MPNSNAETTETPFCDAFFKVVGAHLAKKPEISAAEREALERGFYAWWAENAHALDCGYCGNVEALWAALNGALTGENG